MPCREAIKASDEAAEKSAQHALDAGNLLCEAKAECQHGSWLPFLNKTGINDRRSQRLMTMARWGNVIRHTVSYLGGVTAALRHIQLWDLPDGDTFVWAWPSGKQKRDLPVAMITPSAKYPGYHHVHTAFPLADGGLTGISNEAPCVGQNHIDGGELGVGDGLPPARNLGHRNGHW